MKMGLLTVGLLTMLVLFITGCATGSNVEDTSTPLPRGEVKTFTIEAKNWEFTPHTITVNKGDRVMLHITSIDVTHGIALPDFGVNERLNPGQMTVIEFVADTTGTFPFFCSVKCGEGHSGMRGQVIVK